jgi:ectoine hydroxylase-related dioxygenase (phytanoyl-CoA dioxygenase family)
MLDNLFNLRQFRVNFGRWRLTTQVGISRYFSPYKPTNPGIHSMNLNSAYHLTQAQIDQFRHDGYIKLKDVLDAQTLAYYGSEITRLTIELNTQHKPLAERSTYDKAFLQVMNLWEHSPRVNEFVNGKRLARIAAELLEIEGVRLYHDQSLYKEPGGGITPAHADQYYWPLSSDRTITAWIPLQAVPNDMGPLGFYARSQSVEFGRELGISDESEDKITANMARHGLNFVSTPFELGEVSFHLGWTFHKAGGNVSTQPRSVMTIIYMDSQMKLQPALSPIQANDAAQWCPGILPGNLANSAKNPLLYSR